jgi:glutamate synthase (NADPH/NADH) large chain
MSGGIAYVLDEEWRLRRATATWRWSSWSPSPTRTTRGAGRHQGGDLEAHGLVDVSHDMTRFDAIRLKQLIEAPALHQLDVARRILDDWDAMLPRFVKVMPVDYRVRWNRCRPAEPPAARRQAASLQAQDGGCQHG